MGSNSFFLFFWGGGLWFPGPRMEHMVKFGIENIAKYFSKTLSLYVWRAYYYYYLMHFT